MKKQLMSGVVAVALAVLAGRPASAAGEGRRLWAIAVQRAYDDGTEYDGVCARDVTTSEMSGRLADCGPHHRGGASTVVPFHCDPIPE